MVAELTRGIDVAPSLVGRHPGYAPTEDGFGTAFIDVDEWRDQPVRHRYVHGGFEGTHTLFSFYFPPAETYTGRFFQLLEGGAGGHENLLIPPGADETFLRGSGMMWIFE